MSAMKILDLL